MIFSGVHVAGGFPELAQGTKSSRKKQNYWSLQWYTVVVIVLCWYLDCDPVLVDSKLDSEGLHIRIEL